MGRKGKGAASLDGFQEWYYENMLVRRTESARGRIACEKIEKIGRLVIVESFESDGSNFVRNALRNRKKRYRQLQIDKTRLC